MNDTVMSNVVELSGNGASLQEQFKIAFGEQDWPKAIKLGETLLQSHADEASADIYLQLSVAHRKHRKRSYIKKAEAIATAGMDRFPGDVRLANELAEAAMTMKDWPLAIKRWRGVLARWGEQAPLSVYCRLSHAYRNQGDLKTAEAVARQGLATGPNDYGLRKELAEIALAGEDWFEALKRWTALLDEFPKRQSDALGGISIAHHHLGNVKAADEFLQKCLEIEYALPLGKRRPIEHVFSRKEWESSGAAIAEEQVANLLSYSKTRPDAFTKNFHSYLTIEIDGKKFKGKRDSKDRLGMVPFDLTGKSVIDIGCNLGGALFGCADKIRWGVGIEIDTRLVNAANRIRSHKKLYHLDFYVFNLEKDPLGLIKDLLPEARVDVVFLLAVCAHIKNWRELIDFTSEITDTMLFEAHGHEARLLGQVRHIQQRYKHVELIGKEGSGDPSMRTRRLYLCSNQQQKNVSRSIWSKLLSNAR